MATTQDTRPSYTFTHNGATYRAEAVDSYPDDAPAGTRLFTPYLETTPVTMDTDLDAWHTANVAAMREVAEAALAAAGHPTLVAYSENAGCSDCPCSPGFLAPTTLDVQGTTAAALFVTATTLAAR